MYDHAKRANLRDDTKELIRQHAREIAEHSDFTPERIRQLCENVLSGEELSGNPRDMFGSVLRFLSNPGRRWGQAFEQLNESEQTLLSSMLDFRFSASVDKLKRVYEDRLNVDPRKQLGFADCLTRLSHSFLRTWTSWKDTSYVDFQHPSLRDLLVGKLRDNTHARRQYIEIASPFGIASMCVGLAESQNPEAPTEHVLWPRDDEETALIIERIEAVTRGPLSKGEWTSMLSAADRLIPRVQPQRATAWGWGTRPQKAELRGRALSDFCTTRSGRVLDALIQAFSQTRTFKNNRRFSFDEWRELLDLYYQCAQYVLPFPRPCFIPDILRFAASEPNHSAVKAIALVAHYEPWIGKQVIEREHVEKLTGYLSGRLEDLTAEGESFESKGRYGYDDDEISEGLHDQYHTWFADSEEILSLASTFCTTFGIKFGAELSRLEGLTDSVDEPPAPPEDEGVRRSVVNDTDWTIARIFEDL